MIFRLIISLVCLHLVTKPVDALPPSQSLQISLWAREPMLRDPVALEFDPLGRLYVVQSARRSTVDIDIRQHKQWILDDLANQSINDLRGFFRTKMSPKQSDVNRTWLIDRTQDGSHDWRDLMQVSESVQRLEDSDGDLKADRAVEFATDFQEEITGVAAGVLPLGPDVLFTVYPDLWRLRDDDGDGKADSRQVVHRGFGVHAAFDGHDLHGLTVGPEGKIYFSVGDNGFSVAPRDVPAIHHPNTGGVLRMNPDGSELEVFAIGLRNVQEIAFDDLGNLFAVDNDGDLADERERFVYIVEGGDSGWRLNWQFRTDGWAQYTKGNSYNPWIEGDLWKPHFQGQAAYIVPPISNYSVGPGGFKFNPGTALNDHYRDHFFLCQFPVKKITAFKARAVGASFEMTGEHTFHEGLMASAVNFGPDGALYIADWDGMWAPNGRGKIYRVDDPTPRNREQRQEVADLLRNGVRDRPTAELCRLLGHADRRIRQQAQFELVRRNEGTSFLNVVRDASTVRLARVHAIWGIAQLKGGELDALAANLPWTETDEEIRAQLAKLAGDLRLSSANERVRSLLQDASPRVRFHAAIAIGKLNDASATADIFELAHQNANRDPMLRHAAIMGLANAPIDQLVAARIHPSVHVRSAAVVALRKRRSPEVTAFLEDVDPWVRREAAMASHDDLVDHATLEPLALRLLKEGTGSDEAIIRRALSASFRLARNQDAERLMRFAKDIKRSTEMRREALISLSRWTEVSSYDRVVGRMRKRKPQDPSLAKARLQQEIELLLEEGNSTLEPTLTQIVRDLDLDVPNAVFERWLSANDQPRATRIEAMKTLAARNSTRLTEMLWRTLDSDDPLLRLEAFRILAVREPPQSVEWLQSQWSRTELAERQAGIRQLSQLQDPAASKFLSQLIAQWSRGELQRELFLDVFEAARDPQLKAQLAPLTTADADEMMLHGGDAARGKRIFLNHVGAQCVRCHVGGGGARQAGPDLKGIGKRVDRQYLYESLVDPSKKVAEGFQTVILETVDGRQLSGTVVAEDDASLTLVTPAAKRLNVAKQEIEERTNSRVSSMPSMKELLTRFEIRDVVEYLFTNDR